MTVNPQGTEQSRGVGRVIVLGALTLVLLAGVAFGVNWLWDKRFGPTTASAADCKLAQQLIDQAQNPPHDKAAAEKWVSQIRQVRNTRFEDDGINTEVGKYVQWQALKATGSPERPTTKQYSDMEERAIGHCDDSGVDLRIPKIVF